MRPNLVTIAVYPVGEGFACEGVVRSVRGRRRLHTTRLHPRGFEAAAAKEATAYAHTRGYRILEAEGH